MDEKHVPRDEGRWHRFRDSEILPRVAQGDLEVIRRIYDAWGAGDFSVGLEDLDPHVCFVVAAPFPEPAVLVGPEAISRYMLRFLEQFEAASHTVKATRLRAKGDTVVADVTQHAVGRSSGIEGNLRFFMLFTFRGAKIVRMESILEENDALEVAGLR